MRAPLAALLAVSVAVAMCQPRLGLVVHQHAEASRPHVHGAGEAEDHHPHGHDRRHHHHHAAGADHHHDGLAVAAHDERQAYRPAPPSARAGLGAGDSGFAWHLHVTQPFQHVTLTTPPAVSAPQLVARLALLPPPHRGAAEPIPGRSRAPPSVQSS